jgi:hypothetical protein
MLCYRGLLLFLLLSSIKQSIHFRFHHTLPKNFIWFFCIGSSVKCWLMRFLYFGFTM